MEIKYIPHSSIKELELFTFLAPELFFLILANPLYKMWIIHKPNKLDLWNKLRFEEEKMEIIYHF